MPEYVVYHNPKVMGYNVLDVERLAIYTNKRPADAVGARVWLVTGEGSPRVFKLRSTFIVSGVGDSDKPEFKARIYGKEGHLFHPMPILNAEPWFPQLKRKQGNFAFGFQPINDAVVEAGFRDLLRAAAA